MEILSAQEEPTRAVTETFVSAFAEDLLINFLFSRTTSGDKKEEVWEFFDILWRVRVTLNMPCFFAHHAGEVSGAVMGYNLLRPAWPDQFITQWQTLLVHVSGLAERLEEYEHIAEKFQPQVPHYYLGVIGVRPEQQGGGIGKKLLTRFCEASNQNSLSQGVFLETASDSSLRFYLRNGFVLLGQGMLGRDTPLWCVFRERHQEQVSYHI